MALVQPAKKPMETNKGKHTMEQKEERKSPETTLFFFFLP